MKRGIAAAALLAALAACGNPPTHGTVTHKQHSDAYTYITTTCAGYDSRGLCTIYTTNIWTMPARWELCLENREDTSHDAEGCREVGEDAWHRYQEGDYYPSRDR